MTKIFAFALIGSALVIQSALANTRDDVFSAMQRCGILQDDRVWLDCVYGAQQPMRAKLGLPPAPEYQQRLIPPPISSLPAMAGSFRTPPSAPRDGQASVSQIIGDSAPAVATSTIASVHYDTQGAFAITLENGQVWRQVNTEGGARARLKLGTKVTIKPGALGSYNLELEGGFHMYKVEFKS